MKKFILLLHEDVQQMERLSPKEMERLVQAHLDWARKLGEQGILISGDGLDPQGTRIIGADCIIKDGPYLEAKEMIGGYYLIESEDMAAALKIARECPCHLWGGTTEVRAIMDYA